MRTLGPWGQVLELAWPQTPTYAAVVGEPVEADAVTESMWAVICNDRSLCCSGDWKFWNGAQGGNIPEVVLWPG